MKRTWINLPGGILALGSLFFVILLPSRITSASLVQWQNEVTNVGAMPVTTYFDEVQGSSPLLIDVGTSWMTAPSSSSSTPGSREFPARSWEIVRRTAIRV